MPTTFPPKNSTLPVMANENHPPLPLFNRMDEENDWGETQKFLKKMVNQNGKESVAGLSMVHGEARPANLRLFDAAKAMFFSGQAFKGGR